MFGIFNAKPSETFEVMGHAVNVVSITHNGEIMFEGEKLKSLARDHIEGQIFEIMFATRSGLPYFAYYLCDDYYFAVASGISAPFGGPLKTEQFRSAVSQQVGLFAAQYLLKVRGIDTRREIVSFRHNRAHTNSLTYVSSRGQWCPIQHNDDESHSAAEHKASAINEGRSTLREHMAIRELSPAAF